MATTPDVFIVESLSLEDEVEKRYEGEILARILSLMGKANTTYFQHRMQADGHRSFLPSP